MDTEKTDPDTEAQAVSERYEQVPAASVHGWLIYCQRVCRTVLDVGGDSGRDADWLSDLGIAYEGYWQSGAAEATVGADDIVQVA